MVKRVKILSVVVAHQEDSELSVGVSRALLRAEGRAVRGSPSQAPVTVSPGLPCARVSLPLQVDDIKAAVRDLKEKKIRSLSDEAKIGAHGKPVIFLHPKDCGGVLVELEQA